MLFYLAKMDPNEGMLVLVLVFAAICFVVSLILVTVLWFAFYKITQFRPPYLFSLIFALLGFVAFSLLAIGFNRYTSDLSHLQLIPYSAVAGAILTSAGFMFWQKSRRVG
ncbi:MAG: hypothetical protein AAF364_19905 [Pseudomonadota bacterium]